MSDLHYSILGPLLVRAASDAAPLQLPESRRLVLGRLLVDAGASVSAERLWEDVWDADTLEPEQGLNAVQQAISRLRGDLGDDARAVIVTDGASYRVAADRLAIDAERFKALTRRARTLLTEHPRAARAMLDEALTSWRGPLLGAQAERRWAAPAARELEQLRDAAEIDLNEVRLALGELEELEGALSRQLEEHPFDERRHRQLLQTLVAMGRVAEAGARFRAAYHALGSASPAFLRLGERIGRGAPPAIVPSRAPRAGGVLLHAVPQQPTSRDVPGFGTLVLVLVEWSGEPHPVGEAGVSAVFTEPVDAARAARVVAEHPSLRCAVALHVGGTLPLGDRLAGPGPDRCRLLAEAAHPGQVLVSAAARDRHWPAAGLHDLGEQRYADLLPDERAFALPGATPPEEFPLPATLTRRPHNLPVQPARFVGRARELDELSRWVAAGELVTLLGVGGCGKTRLGLQVAARSISMFPDGAWFVSLAELPADADADAVALTAIAALGARPAPEEAARETLIQHLCDRATLLVLDNCEHLVAACRDLLARVRTRCPGICIVATSRHPLGLDGERTFPVPAMCTALGAALDAVPDAVELLLDRAGPLADAAAPGPELVADAIDLCVALEGSPLSIELVAAQVATRGIAGLAVEVEAMLSGERTLSHFASDDPHRPPRQRTMETTIRWSHELLDGDQRTVLHRLAVFRGAFGMAEAQLVASDAELGERAVASIIATLVDHSMVAAQPPLDGAPRLRLRMPIRAFALEQLERDGGLSRAQDEHIEAYRALASRVATTLFGPGEQRGLVALEADHDNLRVTLSGLVEQQRSDDALTLVGGMWWLWFSRGHFEEGALWTRRVLALDARPSVRRVRALRAGSHLTWWQGDYAQTAHYNDELEACSRAIDDAWGLAWAPMGQGAVRMFQDPGQALLLFEESRRRFEDLGHDWEAAYALQLIGGARWFAGDPASAGQAYEEAAGRFERIGHASVLASVRRGAGMMAALCGRPERGAALCHQALGFSEAIGDRSGSAQALNFLAAIARGNGDLDIAGERYVAALAYAREIGELWATCAALDGIASVACAAGDLALAVRLLARSDSLAKRGGYQRSGPEQQQRAADDQTLQVGLDAAGLEQATIDGQLMSDAEAVASARAFVRRYVGDTPQAPV